MGQGRPGPRPDKEGAVLERLGSASWGERRSRSGAGRSEVVIAYSRLIIIWSIQFEPILTRPTSFCQEKFGEIHPESVFASAWTVRGSRGASKLSTPGTRRQCPLSLTWCASPKRKGAFSSNATAFGAPVGSLALLRGCPGAWAAIIRLGFHGAGQKHIVMSIFQQSPRRRVPEGKTPEQYQGKRVLEKEWAGEWGPLGKLTGYRDKVGLEKKRINWGLGEGVGGVRALGP